MWKLLTEKLGLKITDGTLVWMTDWRLRRRKIDCKLSQIPPWRSCFHGCLCSAADSTLHSRVRNCGDWHGCIGMCLLLRSKVKAKTLRCWGLEPQSLVEAIANQTTHALWLTRRCMSSLPYTCTRTARMPTDQRLASTLT